MGILQDVHNFCFIGKHKYRCYFEGYLIKNIIFFKVHENFKKKIIIELVLMVYCY